MHNLFGDTDSVDVSVTGDGRYQLSDPVKGDTVETVLRYVNFDPQRLLEAYQRQLAACNLPAAEKEAFMVQLEEGIKGYTYLE